MTSKELLYVEDALGHEQFLKTKCCEAKNQISDTELKNSVSELERQHDELFNGFMGLLG